MVENGVVDASVRLLGGWVGNIFDLDPDSSKTPDHVMIHGEAAGIIVATDSDSTAPFERGITGKAVMHPVVMESRSGAEGFLGIDS